MAGPMHATALEGPVLVVGAAGMLGRAWRRELEARGVAVCALNRAELDIRDEASVRDAFARERWRTVVNAAGWTDVDAAERDEAAAAAVNADGPARLAQDCARSGALLVHFSTDYVFDGGDARPREPGEATRPVNAYGRSKALGEEFVAQSGCRALVVRTSWLYAPWGRNFVRWIAGRLANGGVTKLAAEQVGRPTSAEHLVRAACRLVEQGCEGIWHVTGGGSCTRLEMAEVVRRRLNLPGRVEAGGWEAVVLSDGGPPAPRPRFSLLDLAETEAALGPTPDWRETLAEVLDRLE